MTKQEAIVRATLESLRTGETMTVFTRDGKRFTFESRPDRQHGCGVLIRGTFIHIDPTKYRLVGE